MLTRTGSKTKWSWISSLFVFLMQVAQWIELPATSMFTRGNWKRTTVVKNIYSWNYFLFLVWNFKLKYMCAAISWSYSLGIRALVLPGVTTWQTSGRKAFLELRDQTDPHLYSAQSLPHCLLCLPDSLKLIRHPNTQSSCTATHKRMGAGTGVPYQQHLRRRARSLAAEKWMRKNTPEIVI